MREARLSEARSPVQGYACQFCGRIIAPEIRPFHSRMEAAVARRLQVKNPNWNPNQAVCPECVLGVEQELVEERSQVTLHHELMLPYPIYKADEARLIPTPVRIQANPHYQGHGVTMAFLDSGFYPHPDLTQPKNRISGYWDATGAEVTQKEDFSQPHVTSWHGLMTTCVAAGNGHMSGGLYRGIASEAGLVLVKAGNTNERGIHEADIERALAWVIANHQRYQIRIINISLGGDYVPKSGMAELDRLVEQAAAEGLVVVTAAGNSGIERLLPPATAPSAITVGGVDDGNSINRTAWRMYHSNFGRTYHAQRKPELIAPAMWLAAPMLPRTEIHREGMRLWRYQQVIEPLNNWMQTEALQTIFHRNGITRRVKEKAHGIRQRMIAQKFIHPHYQHVDGTSMAAPVVSSIVAQMLEANPSLTPAEVRSLLVGTALIVANIPLERSGGGVINPAHAVAFARRSSRTAWHGLALSPHTQSDQVTFYFLDPTGHTQRAALVGSFNQWQPSGYAMHSPSPGLWQISIPAPNPGTYRYKFLIDGDWIDDPENLDRVEDGYGGFSSILEVRK